MITYTALHNNTSPSRGDITEKGMCTGDAFKALVHIVSLGGKVVKCTPTIILVRTPHSHAYGYLFSGNEEEMHALYVFAEYFHTSSFECKYYNSESLKQVQGRVRLMFRLDGKPSAAWAVDMKCVVEHLNAGKPVGPLT